MLAERYVPLKNIAVSRSSCVRGHYLLTVNTYFFVSNTESTDRVFLRYRYGNYQEIPTDTDQKYRLDTTLYIGIHGKLKQRGKKHVVYVHTND